MKPIVYLFGAGASCKVMPLNKEIPDRLSAMISTISKIEYGNKAAEFLNREELIQDLNWILSESQNHASIDTFAKKLYIKKYFNDLLRLRLGFSVYFTCEQLNKLPDKRYDSFFASIIDNHINKLPAHLKILTWNYDYQIELSYMGFADSLSISDAQTQLNIVPKYSDYAIPQSNSFEIFKLNGDISLKDKNYNYTQFIPNFRLSLNIESLKEIVTKWKEQKENKVNNSCISFAWENNGNQMLAHAERTLAETKILVVIGYSFPFFNREIDKRIISSMLNLEKVYFQAPDANDLIERYKALDSRTHIELISRFDEQQFLIPNEF